MRTKIVLLVVVVTFLASIALAATVKMPPAPTVTVEGATPHGLTVALVVSPELRDAIHVVKTSPFDKMKFATGAFTADLFRQSLPALFAGLEVVEAEPAEVTTDLVLEVSIVSFDLTIPHPAYNPYVSSVVYRIEVFDASGEKVFTQTATGSGQTSKGMMSGFKAQGLSAEAAKLAMVDAVTQILEGLAEAEELRELTAGVGAAAAAAGS
jgi:hypothetical protein